MIPVRILLVIRSVPIIQRHHSLQQMPLLITPFLKLNVNTTTYTHTIILVENKLFYPYSMQIPEMLRIQTKKSTT